MELWAEIDGYCERLGPGLWAEPLNAVTNLAFLLAAWIAWRRSADRTGRRLAAALALVGVASLLFHTLAVAWAGAADSLAIALFAVLYLDAAVRDFLGWHGLRRVAGTLGCVLLLGLGGGLLAGAAPGLGPNAGYIAIAILILGWGLALRPRAPAIGRGLMLAAMLLGVSIGARMLDGPLCDAVPLGTHWMWHFLNAVVLSTLIEVRRRHLEAAEAGR